MQRAFFFHCILFSWPKSTTKNFVSDPLRQAIQIIFETSGLQVDIPLAHGVSWVREKDLAHISSCGQTERLEVEPWILVEKCGWPDGAEQDWAAPARRALAGLCAPGSAVVLLPGFPATRGSLSAQHFKEWIIRIP